MRVSLFYFLFFLVVSSTAQSISGVVLNDEGHVVPGIQVMEVGTQNQVSSDKTGVFKLSSSNKSEVSLQISFTGYESQVLHVKPNEFVEVVLKDANSASTKPKKSKKSKTQREKRKRLKVKEKIFPVSDIQFQGIVLNTLLDGPTGFAVRQSGELGTRATYSTTGLSQKNTRFFIDGVPLEYFGSDYSLSSLPATLLGQVEVYNGWAPQQFLSDNRSGGVVNFKTNEEIEDVLEFNYSFGSFNTHQLSTSGYSRDRKSGLTFKGVAFYNYSDNNYKLWRDDLNSVPGIREEDRTLNAERFNDGYQTVGAKMDLGVSRKEWADNFFISILYGNRYREVQHGASMEVPFGERYYRQETIMPSLTYQKEDLFWKGFDVNFFTAFDTKHRDVFDVSKYQFNWYGEKVEDSTIGEQSEALSYTDDETIISRAVFDYSFNEVNSVSLVNSYSNFGREGDNIRADFEDRNTGEKQELRKNVLGLSFYNNSLDNRFETSINAKYYTYQLDVIETTYDALSESFLPSYYNNTEANYGYGVNVIYNKGSDWQFKASIDKSVIFPTPDQLFGNESENVLSTFGMEGIDELVPEESQNVNLGGSFNNYNFYDHKFNAEANLFYRMVKNYMQAGVMNVDGSDYYFFENHKKIESMGIELLLDYKYINIIDFSLSASYTNAKNKSRTSRGESGNFFDDRLKNEPYLKANAGVKYRFFYDVFKQKTRFELTWTARYTNDYFREWESSDFEGNKIIPAQLVNDFGVNYVFPGQNAFVSLDMRNVFNEQIYDAYAIQQPGRAIFLKVDFKF